MSDEVTTPDVVELTRQAFFERRGIAVLDAAKTALTQLEGPSGV